MKYQYLTHNPEPGDVIVLEEAAYCDRFFPLTNPESPLRHKFNTLNH